MKTLSYFVGVAIIGAVGYYLYTKERTKRILESFFDPIPAGMLSAVSQGIKTAKATLEDSNTYKDSGYTEKQNLKRFFEILAGINMSQALKAWQMYVEGLRGPEREAWIQGSNTGTATSIQRAKVRALLWQEFKKQAEINGITEKIMSKAYKITLVNTF